MSVTLDTSIDLDQLSADDAAMLKELQPNILKSHTREFLSIYFLKFEDKESGLTFLHSIEPLMKSADKHFEEIKKFKDDKIPGSPYVGVGLTASAYRFLGITEIPPDPSFQGSMQGTPDLNDPDIKEWDAHFRDKEKLHAIVLVGDMAMETKAAREEMVVAMINAVPGVMILGTQDGLGLHNANGDGIEHFGYVDGRSQPLFFKEDIEEELGSENPKQDPKKQARGASWDPDFPLGLAIVPDVAAPDPSVHFGSYFILRKLEQNVKKFKEAEKEFAKRLGLKDTERAGALIVGRFEDGTPVTEQLAEGSKHPVPNNFNYDSDINGAKCPFSAHIRKTNPRGSGGKEPLENERLHLMPRRGQTYGVRTDNPNDGETKNKPQKNVGLLFMAFNSSIKNQFEVMQVQWANNPKFPETPDGLNAVGVDPIIGQTKKTNGEDRPPVTCPVTWGVLKPSAEVLEPMKTVPTIPQTVTMKGGEYFFMPSLAFFRALKQKTKAVVGAI